MLITVVTSVEEEENMPLFILYHAPLIICFFNVNLEFGNCKAGVLFDAGGCYVG